MAIRLVLLFSIFLVILGCALSSKSTDMEPAAKQEPFTAGGVILCAIVFCVRFLVVTFVFVSAFAVFAFSFVQLMWIFAVKPYMDYGVDEVLHAQLETIRETLGLDDSDETL